jgi:ribosomal protein S27AE
MTAPNPWPKFGQPPKRLVTDSACPKCGLASLWHVTQVLGESMGAVDHHRVDPTTGAVDNRPIAHPRDRGGVQMRCGRCGYEASYRMPWDAAPVEMPGP